MRILYVQNGEVFESEAEADLYGSGDASARYKVVPMDDVDQMRRVAVARVRAIEIGQKSLTNFERRTVES